MKLFIVDAFADHRFAGNPAAVCWLDQTQTPEWMQSVAMEMNLSETAFVQPRGEVEKAQFELRWFTPAVEVDLCGHATLASAHTLWTQGIVSQDQPIRFHTKSGVLTCTRDGDLIELDFPATPAAPVDAPDGLLDALGAVQPVFTGQTSFDQLVVLDSEKQIRDLKPDFGRLGKVRTRGIIVTGPSSDPQFDFVSRFFCPAVGIQEDPVTGSAHCCLGPYWAERLGKNQLSAFQASSRGGRLRIGVRGERVQLAGKAVTFLEGQLTESSS